MGITYEVESVANHMECEQTPAKSHDMIVKCGLRSETVHMKKAFELFVFEEFPVEVQRSLERVAREKGFSEAAFASVKDKISLDVYELSEDLLSLTSGDGLVSFSVRENGRCIVNTSGKEIRQEAVSEDVAVCAEPRCLGSYQQRNCSFATFFFDATNEGKVCRYVGVGTCSYTVDRWESYAKDAEEVEEASTEISSLPPPVAMRRQHAQASSLLVA